jgi:hypothetical protein
MLQRPPEGDCCPAIPLYAQFIIPITVQTVNKRGYLNNPDFSRKQGCKLNWGSVSTAQTQPFTCPAYVQEHCFDGNFLVPILRAVGVWAANGCHND